MNLTDRLTALTLDDHKATALRIVHPHRTEHVTRAALDDAITAVADALPSPAVVLVPADNDLSAVVRILGAFRAGATPLVLPASRPPEEVLPALAAAVPADVRLLLSTSPEVPPTELRHPRTSPVDWPLPAYYLCTSGTTGTPKLVPQWRAPRYAPQVVPNALLHASGWVTGRRQLVSTPLYHAGPLVALLDGLMDGSTVVLTGSYDGADAVAIAVDEGVNWWQTTPHQMSEALAGRPSAARGLSALRSLFHGVFPCPPDLKREWIAALGADRVHEWYGSTEGYGYTFVRGTDWLARPGTVGKGLLTRLRVLDEQRRPVPTGHEGRVYMRRLGLTAPGGFHGFHWVGDRGRLDADGYLYLTGRETPSA
ncbi:MAG: AMP-binding protein [Saccharothrix sp.]|nr:AMP-binding protein [Saccharothrix sp.]